MTEDKRVVDARRDVAEAQCQYCDRTFKSPRGRSIHERACKEKEHADERAQSGEGSLIESPPSAVASVSKEAAEISEEFAVPPTDEREGGLEVDSRMPDARYVSDPSLEIKQLKAQMEKERKRWEDERRRFLQQTEGLLMDGEPYAAEGLPGPKIEKGPDVEEVLLAEMRIAAELDDLKNELQRKANHETMKDLVESRHEVTNQVKDLDANVEALTNVLGEVSARTLEDLKALGKKLDMKADEGELKSLRDIIARLDGKLDNVVEVVGYEESLNLSKIPPMILELVYQTTLDDVASALIRTLGEMETEKVIQNAMEEVRVRTSGSEMFRYQYPRFKIKGLASSIEKGLVSAKQVQMTYDEILKRLKEHIPQHQAKNFRAMIKVKSQEFAVERSSEISKELASMQSEVETLRQSIAEISKSMSTEISDMASKLSEINNKLKEFEPAVDGKELDDAEGTFEQPSPEIPQETLEGASEESSMEELEKQVLASIPDEGTSLTKLKKLDFRDEDLQSILDSLVQKGLVDRTKRGKGFAYFAKETDVEGGGSDNER
jgi:hypothetical protein